MIGRIDGTNIYLSEDQLPAFTLSLNELTEPGMIRGARSSTIRIVNTKEARRVFSTQPMRSPSRSGEQTLTIGEGSVNAYRAKVVPTRTDSNEIEAFAVGGNASWFDWARSTKVSDLDLGQSEEVTAAYQRGTTTDTDDILIFPLVDFGAFEGQSSTYDVQVTQLRPGLRIGRVLEDAFATQGLRIQPRGTLAKHWRNFVHFEPSANVQSISLDTNPDNTVVRPAAGGSQTLTTTPVLSVPGYINCTTVSDPNSHWSPVIPSLQRYLVPFNCKVLLKVRGLDIGPIPSALNGTQLRLVLYEKNQNIPLAVLLTSVVTTGATITIDVDFPAVNVEAGMQLNLGVWNETASNENVTASPSSARITFIPITRPYAAGCPLEIASCAKDFKVIDLFTGITGTQFLVADTNMDSGEVSLWYEAEYYRTPAPGVAWRDWSDRMDHSTLPAKTLDPLPRQIRYGWKEDSSDISLTRQATLLNAPGYGNAVVEIGGRGAPQEITSMYSATAMGFVLGGLRVPIMRDSNTAVGIDNYRRSPRILYCDGEQAGEWTHDGNSETTYPRCYFAWDSTGHPVAWGNVEVYADEATDQTVGVYGASRHRQMKYSRLLECALVLRDHELQDFDHGMPTLVDDGSGPAWYYVQEINNHRFGKNIPTKCVLVEIPGTIVDADSVTPDNGDVEYPELIVNPPFVPPCTNAPRFPNTPTLVSYRVSASSQAAVEADPTSYPVGMRFAIACLSGGGSANWDAWVGDVVQRVAPGTGTDGSAWQRLNLAPGSIVENADFASATQWDRYLITDSVANFMTYYTFKLVSMDSGGNCIFDHLYDPCGTMHVGVGFINTFFPDTCRGFIIQTNTTTNPATGWVDVGTEHPVADAETFGSITLPPGSLYARVKWTRGSNIQGYSDRTLIV